jgi:hypothetical protein
MLFNQLYLQYIIINNSKKYDLTEFVTFLLHFCNIEINEECIH